MPRTRRSLAVGAVAAVVLAGCALGERPVLGPPGDTVPTAPTGNDQLDTVLGLLDSADGATFTASYELRTLFGSLDSTALVSRGDDLGTSITIENADRRIRFLADAEGERTCDLVAGTCEDGFDDARISDTQLPHDFWGRAFASRLRADANRRIADPVLYEDDVAGRRRRRQRRHQDVLRARRRPARALPRPRRRDRARGVVARARPVGVRGLRPTPPLRPGSGRDR